MDDTSLKYEDFIKDNTKLLNLSTNRMTSLYSEVEKNIQLKNSGAVINDSDIRSQLKSMENEYIKVNELSNSIEQYFFKIKYDEEALYAYLDKTRKHIYITCHDIVTVAKPSSSLSPFTLNIMNAGFDGIRTGAKIKVYLRNLELGVNTYKEIIINNDLLLVKPGDKAQVTVSNITTPSVECVCDLIILVEYDNSEYGNLTISNINIRGV